MSNDGRSSACRNVGDPVVTGATSASSPAEFLPSFAPDPAGPTQPDPDQLWQQFATALAGRPRVRISRDGGHTYTGERRLDSRRPDWPAAVCLFDDDGRAHALAIDLDTSRGGSDQVTTDTAELCAVLDRAGARYLVDRSPSGGHHVWVPLARPRPAAELRRVAYALAALLPSLDPTPLLNPATGCLRPPGAAHPAGGHQELVTPWARAVDAVRTRTGDAAWTALLDALAPQLAGTAARAAAGGPGALASPTAVARPGGPRPLPPAHAAIARTGRHDPDRYPSPSEARMAVLASAAALGWSLTDVRTAVADGRWPGLARYYVRYGPHHRGHALHRDWTNALTYAAALFTRPAPSPVSISDTGETPPQPPPADDHSTQPPLELRPLSDYVHLRVWRTAVDLATPQRWADRAGQSKRAVLAALAEAGQRRGTRYVDVGTRSLGLGAALDHSTVAATLRALRSERDPVVVLVEDHRGERGDLYELRIPDSHRKQAEALPWRRGRLTGLHPVFHELGVPAAHLYDAITTGGPAGVEALATASHLSRATVYRTAELLVAHGLLTRAGGHWRRTRLRLDGLARRLKVPTLISLLLSRIRAERRQWRTLLALGRQLGGPHPVATLTELARHGPPPPPEPPPDPPMTPLELLQHVLGATLLDQF